MNCFKKWNFLKFFLSSTNPCLELDVVVPNCKDTVLLGAAILGACASNYVTNLLVGSLFIYCITTIAYFINVIVRIFFKGWNSKICIKRSSYSTSNWYYRVTTNIFYVHPVQNMYNVQQKIKKNFCVFFFVLLIICFRLYSYHDKKYKVFLRLLQDQGDYMKIMEN